MENKSEKEKFIDLYKNFNESCIDREIEIYKFKLNDLKKELKILKEIKESFKILKEQPKHL